MSAIVRNPNALPLGKYCKPFDRRMRPVSEAGYTPGDDMTEAAELVDITDEWAQVAVPMNPVRQEGDGS